MEEKLEKEKMSAELEVPVVEFSFESNQPSTTSYSASLPGNTAVNRRQRKTAQKTVGRAGAQVHCR
jgi:hypothetical protein